MIPNLQMNQKREATSRVFGYSINGNSWHCGYIPKDLLLYFSETQGYPQAATAKKGV